ncbi:MAG TPA: hypothetical protein VGW34_04610 [Allosphingosinicella sp.]|nr:hypothetical protein [Allosphingosinicella sp.]
MATRSSTGEARQTDRIFFTGMGLFVAVLVFAGFARTYYLSHWLEPPARTPDITPLLHLHAIVFTGWTLLQAAQPALIARGRVALHRALGTAGAGLALMVWLLGNLAAVEAIHAGYKGVGDPYAFYAITFFSIQAFGLIVVLGILRRRDAAAHKRLMLLSSAAILEAAVGRLPLELVVETAPLSFYLGADLIILAGIVYDWASRGRVHPVWAWGGGALVASQALRVAIMDTGPWLAFARAMAALA